MKKTLPFLAVAFSGFLVYLFDKIWGSSIDWKEIRTLKFGEWLYTTIPFKIYEIILFVLIAIPIYLIANKYFKKDRFFSSKQKKLRAINQEADNVNGLLFRWSVWFHDDDTPFIADLATFCTKHPGAPIRFVGNRCPYQNCINHRQAISPYMVKNTIESGLIDQWEKMK